MSNTAVENKNNALARFDDVRALLADFPEDRFISLVPTVFQERSDLYVPAVMIVRVNPEDKQDVYDSPERDGNVCLRGRKQAQIGNALGVKWLGTHYDRQPDSVTATVSAEITDAIGDRVPLSASATEYLSPKAGRSVSKYPDEKAETRAMTRIVKKLTGQPSSFSKDDLRKKAFVGVRWQLDDKIPEVRKAVIERGLSAASAIYGRDASDKAIDAGHEPPEEVIDVTPRQSADDDGPEIPDAPPAAIDVRAVAAAFQQRARARKEQQKADKDLLGTLAFALADVYGVAKTDKEQLGEVRKGIASTLFGQKVGDLTVAQVMVVLEATKDPTGQAQLTSLADVIGVKSGLAAAAGRLG
jgi:hypothetical protein